MSCLSLAELTDAQIGEVSKELRRRLARLRIAAVLQRMTENSDIGVYRYNPFR